MLGLSGYFRKYISKYAANAKPLTDLLRNSPTFNFGPEEQAAFSTLKQMLKKEPVLHLFFAGSVLEIHTEAYKFGYEAVFLQNATDDKFHPVLHMSKKTSPPRKEFALVMN